MTKKQEMATTLAKINVNNWIKTGHLTRDFQHMENKLMKNFMNLTMKEIDSQIKNATIR